MARKYTWVAALIALVVSSSLVWAQSAPLKYLSTVSTNATLVRAGRTMIKILLPINTTSTIYYLKLYNKATAPACGTDTPLWTVPVPNAAGAGAGASVPIAAGLQFPLGLGFCLTGAIADSDSSNAAVGVAINLGVSGY